MPNAGDIVVPEHVTYPTPVQDSSPDNNSAGTAVTTTPSNGSTVCGASFVAPESGRVLVSFNGSFTIHSTGGTGQVHMGPQVREGSTVGSGTVVYNPSGDPGCKTGSSLAQTWSSGCSAMVDGLTAGDTYNVAAVFFTPDASGSPKIQYFSRQVSAIPLP